MDNSSDEAFDIEKLCALAKLSLSPDERKSLRDDLTEMISFASLLHSPLPSPTEAEPIAMREDIPVLFPDIDQLLRDAARDSSGGVVVPLTVTGE